MATLLDDPRVRMALIIAAGLTGIGIVAYFLFVAKPYKPTTADVTGALAGQSTPGACAYLELTAMNLDKQGVPLESGMTRAELMGLAGCGGPYSTYAANWLAAHPIGGGGGGSGSARTE